MWITQLPAKRKLGEHKITAPRWQTCWSLGLGLGLKLARHDVEVDVALTSSSCLANPNLTLTHLLRLILVVDLVALHWRCGGDRRGSQGRDRGDRLPQTASVGCHRRSRSAAAAGGTDRVLPVEGDAARWTGGCRVGARRRAFCRHGRLVVQRYLRPSTPHRIS